MDNRIFEQQYGEKKTAYYSKPFGWIQFIQNHSTNRIQAVSQLLPDKKMRVLEIGCGDGTFLFQNREKWKKIVGVDIVRAQLRKARSRSYGCPSKFIQADYGRGNMPFESNSFNICISISTLQYLYDLDLLFENVYRVLTRNGLWIFEVPNIAFFWRRIEFLFGRLPKTSHYKNAWDAGVIHYFTHHDLQEFCLRKGFIVESVQSSGIMHSIRSLWPDMLGSDFIFVCRKK